MRRRLNRYVFGGLLLLASCGESQMEKDAAIVALYHVETELCPKNGRYHIDTISGYYDFDQSDQKQFQKLVLDRRDITRREWLADLETRPIASICIDMRKQLNERTKNRW